MTLQNPMSFLEFDDALESARSRFNDRISGLNKLAAGKFIYLFGYGGKGRALASHIDKESDVKVIVYDSNPKTRDLAEREGFSTINNPHDMRREECGVILGACQAQLEQL